MIASWDKDLGTVDTIEESSQQTLLLRQPASVNSEGGNSNSSVSRAAPLKILILEDSAADACSLVISLCNGLATPFEFDQVDKLADALALIGRTVTSKADDIGLIITDLNLPDSVGFDTFLALNKHAGDVPIVILSGQEDVELALESVRLGAQDYVVKGATTAETLGRIVRFAIERGRRLEAERELDQANNELEIAHSIQRTLYPSSAADLPGFDIAGAAFPAAKACGDYYDFVPISDGRQGITVGDVLFVPTDGFHEAANSRRELYGESRMLDTIQELRTLPAASIIQQLYSQVRTFTGVLPQQDDMAAIVLKVQ